MSNFSKVTRKRLKIYTIVRYYPTVTPRSGDLINEILIYKILSLFADVYYNGQLFQSSKPNYGLTKKVFTPPSRNYDLYYIRNNYDLWRTLPSPKITTALPYVRDMFLNGDGVVTYSKTWRDKLAVASSDIKKYFYKKNVVRPYRAIYFPQAYEPMFKPLQDHPKTLQIRKQWGSDFTVVYFGRLHKTSYPHSLIKLIPRIRQKYKDKKIRFLFAGSNLVGKINMPGIEWLGNLNHNLMPYYLSASDVYMCQYHHTACNYYGSRHTIECMATGLPIICADFSARKEMLGDNYPLFWKQTADAPGGRLGKNAEEHVFSMISKLIDDKKFRDKVKDHLIDRSKLYSFQAISDVMRKEIDKVIKNPRKNIRNVRSVRTISDMSTIRSEARSVKSDLRGSINSRKTKNPKNLKNPMIVRYRTRSSYTANPKNSTNPVKLVRSSMTKNQLIQGRLALIKKRKAQGNYLR